MKLLKIFLFTLFSFVLAAGPVKAARMYPPAVFFGSVTVNGAPAPDNFNVSAKINGVQYATIATKNGWYGITGSATSIGNFTFLVPSDDSATPAKDGGVTGDDVNFFVNGTDTGEVAGFQSGVPVRIDLTVSLDLPTPTPPAGGGGGGGTAPLPTGPTTTQIDANLMGTGTTLVIDSTGKFVNTVQASSEDGAINIKINKDTIGLDKNKKPLNGIDVRKWINPPPPPTDKKVIGIAYEFQPSGATFNPPFELEYTLKPEDIPANVAEKDLVLAFYNSETGAWETVECVVDPVTHKITAKIPHFTIFAVIGNILATMSPQPNVPAPSPTANVPASPTLQIPPEQKPTAAPPAATPSAPAVTSSAPAGGENKGDSGLNWTLFGAIGGGVLIVGAVAFIVLRRNRY